MIEDRQFECFLPRRKLREKMYREQVYRYNSLWSRYNFLSPIGFRNHSNWRADDM